MQQRLTRIPDAAWHPAVDGDAVDGDAVDGKPAELRDAAWVAEATAVFDLTGWPTGMRLNAGKEGPHPGAQLRITDIDGLRVTAFVTNTTSGDVDHAREGRSRTCSCGTADVPAQDRAPVDHTAPRTPG